MKWIPSLWKDSHLACVFSSPSSSPLYIFFLPFLRNQTFPSSFISYSMVFSYFTRFLAKTPPPPPPHNPPVSLPSPLLLLHLIFKIVILHIASSKHLLHHLLHHLLLLLLHLLLHIFIYIPILHLFFNLTPCTFSINIPSPGYNNILLPILLYLFILFLILFLLFLLLLLLLFSSSSSSQYYNTSYWYRIVSSSDSLYEKMKCGPFLGLSITSSGLSVTEKNEVKEIVEMGGKLYLIYGCLITYKSLYEGDLIHNFHL